MKGNWLFAGISLIIALTILIYLSDINVICFYVPDYSIDVVLAILILRYVIDTYLLAVNANVQSKINTTPVVTAKILSKGDSAEWFPEIRDKNYKVIDIAFINHTPLHATVKVKVSWSGTIAGEKISGEMTKGLFNGKEEWNFPAKYRLKGNVTIEAFDGVLNCKGNDRVNLTIELWLKPYNESAEYQKNPTIQYYWDLGSKRWLPSPVPLLS